MSEANTSSIGSSNDEETITWSNSGTQEGEDKEDNEHYEDDNLTRFPMPGNISIGTQNDKWRAIEDVDMNGPIEIGIMDEMKQFSERTLGISQPRPFQLEAAVMIKRGHDVMVTVNTGGGKTLIFQLLLAKFKRYAKPGYVVIISPLVALIDEQVAFLNARNVSAIGITGDTLAEDKSIWAMVEKGKYRAVFVTPEMILSPGSYFWHKIAPEAKNGIFASNIHCFCIDEGHLIWQWGWSNFRTEYSQIGSLRAYFENTPFLVMSATITPLVRSYIHSTLDLHRPTITIRKSIIRTNIDIHIIPLKDAQHDFSSLDFLVKDVGKPACRVRPPKTMVFVDNRSTTQAIALYLRSKLAMNGLAMETVRGMIYAYHSVQDKESKDIAMEAFRTGKAFILICTEAAGMGMNIPDVEIVIQFRIPDFLGVADLYQRLGRCARNHNIKGLALVFVEERFLIPAGCTGFASSVHNFQLPINIHGDAMEVATVKKHIQGLHLQSNYDGKLLRIDPSLLWFLNSHCCKMRIILAIFDDPDLYQEDLKCNCSECLFGERTIYNQLLPPDIIRNLLLGEHENDSTGTRQARSVIGSQISAMQPPQKRGRKPGVAAREKVAAGSSGGTRSLTSTAQLKESIMYREHAISLLSTICDEYTTAVEYGFDIRQTYRYQDTALCDEESVEKELVQIRNHIIKEVYSEHGLSINSIQVENVPEKRTARTPEQKKALQALLVTELTKTMDSIYELCKIQERFRIRRNRFFSPECVDKLAKKIAFKGNCETVTKQEFVAAFDIPIILEESVFAEHFDYIQLTVSCLLKDFDLNIITDIKNKKRSRTTMSTSTGSLQYEDLTEEQADMIAREIDSREKKEKLRIRRELLRRYIKNSRLQPILPFKESKEKRKGN